MRLQSWTAGAVAVLVLTGCSGSSSKPALLAPSIPATTTAGPAASSPGSPVAPTPSSGSTAASASAGPGASTPPATTGPAPATSASPPVTTTKPPVTPKALSPFDTDPGVKALRAWADQAARTVNTGHYTDAALRALMTPAFNTQMKEVLGDDVGLHYPGPVPFQPLGVTVPSPSRRLIRLCDIEEGFAMNPKTGKAARPLLVGPATASAALVGGRWIVESLTATSSFSCKGVKVRAPKW